jgi:uncharacterized protein DUF3572
MPKAGPVTRETAEKLGVAALGYLAGEPEELGRFLALSGLGPENIRRAASDPAFLSGILEYVTGEERLLVAFAAHVEMAPETIVAAQHLLSGRAK